MSGTVLEVSGLTKRFGSRTVIDGLDCAVNAGEIFGFLGPNGSGKTTTIKMILGFLFPDAGSIRICGYDRSIEYEKAMGLVGGIVENPEMYVDLSGRKNLELYARIHDDVPKERIDEVIELVGMQNRANEKVKRYSLGMKQRICLAQSLLHKPKLLILDEPTNGLDPNGIYELRTILQRLAHEEQVGIMVSSHILAEMQHMCDRVGILANGKIVGTGMVEDLIASAEAAVRVRVRDAQAAAEILAGTPFSDAVPSGDPENAILEVRTEESGIPALIRCLCENGVDVFRVERPQSSLEEAFMAITGGEHPIA